MRKGSRLNKGTPSRRRNWSSDTRNSNSTCNKSKHHASKVESVTASPTPSRSRKVWVRALNLRLKGRLRRHPFRRLEAHRWSLAKARTAAPFGNLILPCYPVNLGPDGFSSVWGQALYDF